MFQLLHRPTRETRTVFGVRKSGPSHEQTKFLIHDTEGWRWHWAEEFEPLAQPSSGWTPNFADVA